MARLTLSVAARADLQEIRAIGVRDFGPAAAEAHLHGFRQRFQLLRQHPHAGQERPEFASNMRSLSHRPHSILYAVEGDVVVIIRIIHQARDVRTAFREQS